MTSIASIEAARDHVANVTGGKLDCLVNNSGHRVLFYSYLTGEIINTVPSIWVSHLCACCGARHVGCPWDIRSERFWRYADGSIILQLDPRFPRPNHHHRIWFRIPSVSTDKFLLFLRQRYLQLTHLLYGSRRNPFLSGYGASKAVIHAYGDTLRLELQPFG